jgi:hypothetical protein
MKQVLYIALVVVILIFVIYCILPKSNVNSNDQVELILIYDEQDIQVVLPDDEANKVKDILVGNLYDPFPGTPACGFLKCYGFKIGDNYFAMPLDSCNTINDSETQRYFVVSQEEMDYLRSLFQKYDR